MRLRRLVAAGLVAALAMVAGPQTGRADTESARAYLLKAAFVYNFAKFVDWPTAAFATEGAPLNLCVLGREAFIQFAAAMKGKSIANRPVAVFDTARSSAPAQCHIAFLDADDSADAGDIARVARVGGLSVSDAKDFIRGGGMVGLITVDNKMRFEVNLSASRKAGIRINAALLRLAKTVIE